MDAHRQAMRHSSKEPNWRTPPKMVAKLCAVFPIEIDLAADRASAVVQHYLGPGAGEGLEDALQVAWHTVLGGPAVGFLNAPYSLTRIKELREQEEAIIDTPLDTPERNDIFQATLRALRIESWAEKAYRESLLGFTTIGVFPYAPQTRWFRRYVMGHLEVEREPGFPRIEWEHAALDFWRLPHRVQYLLPDGTTPDGGANVNTCVIHWGPNPGFVGPWVPSGRYWSYR